MKCILIGLLCLFSCGGLPQENKHNFFIKERIDCDFQNSAVNKYYKLTFLKSNLISKCSYLNDFSKYSDSEKVEMIEELLEYEGDTSLCSVMPKCYSALRSQTVPLEIKVYSTQVEALFIINHIIVKDPYRLSAFPILKNSGRAVMESVNGPLIKQAYVLYKEWLKEVKKKGLSNLVNNGILPLKNSEEVYWL